MNEKIAVVVSKFNHEITDEMSKVAQQRIKKYGAKLIKIIEVPGAFEIPFAVNKLLKDKNIDGIVTLGTVIKGDTNHDEVVAHSVARKLLDLSAKYDKPVSLGISGPNITWEQSKKRIKEYADRSVDTVIEMLRKN